MATIASTLFLISTGSQRLFDSSFHGSSITSSPVSVGLKSRSVSASVRASPGYVLNAFTFDPIKESIISHEMTRRYMTDMITYADTDGVVVGAGSPGLSCAYEISKNPNVQVAIIEQSVSLGGGAWLSGQLFSVMIVRKPAHLFLDEIGVAYDEQDNYVVINNHEPAFGSF